MRLPPHVQPSPTIIRLASRTPNFWHVGPFTTTNGCISPIYPDMRTLFSDPNHLRLIAREIWAFIQRKKIRVDYLIGGATAGIPLSAAVSLLSGIPAGYVRKTRKGGGLNRLVEGAWKPGMRAILIEDAIGHGDAKQIFIKNIRKSGLNINWVIVALSRSNRHEKYFHWMRNANVHFQSFGDCFDIIDYSLQQELISQDAGMLLYWYFEDAFQWSRDPGKLKFFQEYKKRWKRGEYKTFFHGI